MIAKLKTYLAAFLAKAKESFKKLQAILPKPQRDKLLHFSYAAAANAAATSSVVFIFGAPMWVSAIMQGLTFVGSKAWEVAQKATGGTNSTEEQKRDMIATNLGGLAVNGPVFISGFSSYIIERFL